MAARRRARGLAKARLGWAACAMGAAWGASAAWAQCPESEWAPFLGPNNGVNSLVLALTTWDPDGAGPLPPQLVAGGNFTNAGGVSARTRIARWDGAAWQPFGSGAGATVRAVLSWDADGDGPLAPMLVAAGNFDSAGGVSNTRRIAAWDGAAWQALGTGLDLGNGDLAYALTAWDPDGAGPLQAEVVAGGSFLRAGGVFTNNIAHWNGTAWQPFGAVNTGMNDWVRALTTWDPDGDGPLVPQLVAGGDFTEASSEVGSPVTVNRIARWDGTAWQPFGTGMDNQVYTLTTWDPDGAGPLAPQLVAGGHFTTAGGVTVNRIARWDGTAWHAFGTGMGMDSVVQALTTWDPDGDGPAAPQLVAAGIFTTAEGATVNCITRWDGSAWQAFGVGLDNNRQAFSLTTWDPDGEGPLSRNLVVGGGFTQVGDGSTATRIARYTPAGAAPTISQETAVLGLACTAGPVTCTVGATGTGTLTYQWQIEVSPGVWVDLTSSAVGLPCGGSATATAPTADQTDITVVPCPGVDAYQVRCVVSNDCGGTPSGAATYRVCRADFNCSGAVSVQDIFDFLAAYFSNAPSADVNGSGGVSVQDIFDFLAAYFTGCV